MVILDKLVKTRFFKLSIFCTALFSLSSLVFFIVYESLLFPTGCSYAHFCIWAVFPLAGLAALVCGVWLYIRYKKIQGKICMLYNQEIDGLEDLERR
jgi:hypothetical protein